MLIANRSSKPVKTCRQWAKLGRVPKEDIPGERMYSNGMHQKTYEYWTRDQTREATPEELEAIRKPERARNRKYRERQQAIHYRTQSLKAAQEAPELPCDNPSGIVVFDVETTGLTGDDEILQISAIDGAGNTLINTYIKPYLIESWEAAQAIHGITPEMVAAAPEAHELIPKLRGIFNSAELLVSYNGGFDMRFLYDLGINLYNRPHYDVMLEFAPICGEWDSYYGDYKWQKLTKCAAYYGYTFKAHDSLEDVRATLHCYNAMKNQDYLPFP